MRVVDPGHCYDLKRLDGDGHERITYVKREGEKFPMNVGHHPGTNLQEGWRAEIHRLGYLNAQAPHWTNLIAIENLRQNIKLMEVRAAERHGRATPGFWVDVENMPTCAKCGHIGCVESEDPRPSPHARSRYVFGA